MAKNQFKCQKQKTLTKVHENINTIRYNANWVKVTSIDLPNLPQNTLWGKNFQILATPNISISFPMMDETQLQLIIQTDTPHIMFVRLNCMTDNLVNNFLRISWKVQSIISRSKKQSKQIKCNTTSSKWDASIQTIYYTGWLRCSTELMDKRIILQESKAKQNKRNKQCNPIYLEHRFKCTVIVFISVF